MVAFLWGVRYPIIKLYSVKIVKNPLANLTFKFFVYYIGEPFYG